METQIVNATEHRDLPLSMLFESPSNPRRNFDENFLKGMAASMRVQGVLQRLLARPKEKGFEIVFGAQRYRAAQIGRASHHSRRYPRDVRRRSVGGSVSRKPSTPRRSPYGRGARLQRTSRLGGAKVHRRADRRKNGKDSCLCNDPPQTDRPCSRRGRGILCRRDWRRPCAPRGEAPTRPAGTGAVRLLQRGLQRGAETQPHPATRPQPAVLD